MADYSSFEEGAVETDYSSFDLIEDEVPKAPNRSEKHVAAQLAVLNTRNPEELIDNFNLTVTDLSAGNTAGVREGFNRRRAEAHKNQLEMINNSTSDFLSGKLSEQELEVIVGSTGQVDAESSDSELIIKEASEPLENETVDLMSTREAWASSLDSIKDLRRARQEAFTSLSYTGEDGTLNALADFTEVLIPFAEQVFTSKVISGIRAGDKPSIAKAITFMGSAKADMRDWFQELGPYEKVDFIKGLSGLLQTTKGITTVNDNEALRLNLLTSVTNPGEYGENEELVDNVFSVLDWVGLGGLVKGFIKGGKAAKASRLKGLEESLQNSVDDIGRRFEKESIQPSSVYNDVQQVNPEKARKMYAAVDVDETGDFVDAVAGTESGEFFRGSHGPQVSTESGNVLHKPNAPDVEVLRQEQSLGRADLSRAEISNIELYTRDRLENVVGLSQRAEMSTMTKDKDFSGMSLKNVYGPKDGGFTNASEAIEEVLFSLRTFGITEDNITLLRRVGDEYVPTTLKEVTGRKAVKDVLVKTGKPIPEELSMGNMLDDYLVQVDHKYSYDPVSDLNKFEPVTVKKNFLDRFAVIGGGKPGEAGAAKWIFDAASMHDPKIILGANSVFDASAGMQKILTQVADNFTTKFKKLDVGSQKFLDEVFQKSNFQRTWYSEEELKGMGMSRADIDTYYEWKNANDQLYWTESRDFNKTLTKDGYGLYQDKANNTSFVAKPIGKQSAVNRVKKAYDSELDKVVAVDSKMIDDLYEAGGDIATFRDKEVLDGEVVEFIINKNSTKQYIRKLNDYDNILNYIPGHYHIDYKSPHFIDKVFLDATGNEVRQAVHRAGDIKTADMYAAKLTKEAPEGTTYVARKAKETLSGPYNIDYYNTQKSSGRVNQRRRGKLVGQVSDHDSVEKMTTGRIVDPITSLSNSIEGISRRVYTREFIDTYKARIVNTNPEFFPLDDFGKPRWTGDITEIKPAARETSKEMADIRSHINYVNQLEHGWKGWFDRAYAGVMDTIADTVGGKTAKGERFVRGVLEETENPTALAKRFTSDMFLALNPPRQLLVQGHQITTLSANFPKYFFSEMFPDIMSIYQYQIMKGTMPFNKIVKRLSKDYSGKVVKSEDEIANLVKEFDRSGLGTIDRHNLVNSGIDSLVETGRFRKVKKGYKYVVGTGRALGFNPGENLNMLGSWLCHRDEALKKATSEGRKLDAKDLADASGKARNYMYNMNWAGAQPYEHSALSAIFQYFAVSHKGMLTMTTNRVLSGKEKAALLAFNAAMLPKNPKLVFKVLGITGLTSYMAADDERLEALTNGLTGWFYNKAIQGAFDADGEESQLSFASLTAADPDSVIRMFELLDGNVIDSLASTPVGNIGNRLYDVATEFKNLWTMPETPIEKFGSLVGAIGDVPSFTKNFSDGFKELLVKGYATRYNAEGDVVAEGITTPESFAKMLFGLETYREHLTRATTGEYIDVMENSKEELKQIISEVKKHYARQDGNMRDWEFKKQALSALFSIIPASEVDKREFVLKELERDAQKDPDTSLKRMIIKKGYGGMMSEDEFKTQINMLPIPAEEKTKIISTWDKFKKGDE